MSPDHPLLLPVAIGVMVLILILLLWLRFRPAQLECKDPLFTPEFRAFFGQLDIAVRSHLTIFPNMPVQDVLQGSGAGKSLLRKFKHKRFDFVICHRKEMEVLCIIKLGNNESKEQRKLCQTAGLTLLEYDIKPYRDVPSLRKDIFSACGIDDFELSMIDTEQDNSSNAPSCSKCQTDMLLRIIKKGDHAGEKCWVCTNYPDCKSAKLIKHVA